MLLKPLSLRRWLGIASLFSAAFAWAAPTPMDSPRSNEHNFVNKGLFEGGSAASARIEDLHLHPHTQDGFERWIVDFTDNTGRHGAEVAPRFQISYSPAEKIELPNGTFFQRRPAKFTFFFRSITRNKLTLARVSSLAAHSKFVEKIHVYPPVEQGDMAMEFVLKDDVVFEPHPPSDRDGRLMLDIKSAPIS